MFSFSVLDRFNFSKITRLEMHIRLGNHQCVTKMQRPNYREVLSEMIQYVEHRLRQVNAGWMYIFQEKNEEENENFVNPFLHCIALPDWLIVYCLRRKFKSVALYGPSNSDFNSVITPRSAHDYGYNSFNEIYFRDSFSKFISKIFQISRRK